MPVRAPHRRAHAVLMVALVALLLAAGLLTGVTTTPAQAATGTTHGTSAGGEFTCTIRDGGTLWCWGRNNFGQLGRGTMDAGSAVPQQVGKRGDWAQVSTGGATACAVGTGHGLFCWGLDHRGQLGDGAKAARTTPTRVPGKRNWAQVATGWFHTCAVRTNGSLWCWGDNSGGQLGIGSTTQDLKLHRVPGHSWRSVAVAGWNTCAIKTDSTLWCWGRNGFGQVGVGDLVNRTKPVQVGRMKTWKQVALTWTHACGVGRGGTVRCWGRNDLDQVGDPSHTYVTSPYVVPGDHLASAVAVAEGSSCLLDQAGSLWCWGDNRYGQVSSSAPATPGARVPVSRGGTFTSISGGWYHFCAARSTGVNPTCWGNDERGQLGRSKPTPRPATPKVPHPRRNDGPLTLRLATFNTLGNQHTQPFHDADHFPPSRVRADWESQILGNNRIDVAGIEEQDAGQLAAILGGTGGRYASFPTPDAGDVPVETAVVWDTADYKAVETKTVRTRFISRYINRPMVKLKQLSTGRQFWVMAVHNAPQDQQAHRNEAVKTEIAALQKLEKDGLPVFFVGDFNERTTVMCKVLTQTGLGSASGGHVDKKGHCVPPKQMRVDWIFGSKSLVQWSGFAFTKPPLARLSTDHMIPVVDVTAP